MNTPTARDWQAYQRGQRALMARANSRPILNPKGPTALIPNQPRKLDALGNVLLISAT